MAEQLEGSDVISSPDMVKSTLGGLNITLQNGILNYSHILSQGILWARLPLRISLDTAAMRNIGRDNRAREAQQRKRVGDPRSSVRY